MDMNAFIKKNPNKLAFSPRTLGKGFGEFELVLPPKSVMTRVKNLEHKLTIY
jgi:hypothetical protein